MMPGSWVTFQGRPHQVVRIQTTFTTGAHGYPKKAAGVTLKDPEGDPTDPASYPYVINGPELQPCPEPRLACTFPEPLE